MADALSTVAQVLETSPFYLRSTQIRQVDKALHFIENLTPPSLIHEVKRWKESYSGKLVLQNKLNALDQAQKQIETMETQIEILQQETRCWYGLAEEKRLLIVENAKRAEDFLRNQGHETEADVIQRYNRSLELKQLLPYGEKAPYFCDAIYHYSQQEVYRENLNKLNQRIIDVQKRIKTIRNGFYLALFLCVFIATIPICIPFSITLWKKRHKLKSHLIVYEDLQRREHKRLESGREGEQILQEIAEIMGPLSEESIKELLMEAKELKEEFCNSERFLSVCAMILNYIDTHQEMLVELFGQIPQSPHDRFAWLSQNVRDFENKYQELEALQSQRHDLCLHKKQTTKGYDRNLLIEGIEQLQKSLDSMLKTPIDTAHKPAFVEICLQLPEITKKIRETIYFISQNLEINSEDWNTAKLAFKRYSYDLALYVVDSEMEEHLKFTQESVDKRNNSTYSISIDKGVLV